MKNKKEIPPEILKQIKVLSSIFAKTINNVVYSKEDLYNDLVVVYLTKINTLKSTQNCNSYWFILFKNYLLNLAKHLNVEKSHISKLEEINYENQDHTDNY